MIVIIAILAAISIIAYRGIQDRANSSSAQAAVRQATTKIQLEFVDSESYPTALADIGITDSGLTSYQYSVNNTSNPKSFCITATTGNKSFYANSLSQKAPAEGGCPGHGQGGAIAVRNLVRNPNFTGTGNMPTGWFTFSQGTSNVISRSLSSGVETLTATSLVGGNRRAGMALNESLGTIPANSKYFTARLTVDTTGLAPGTRLSFYFDLYNSAGYSNHSQSFSATTTSTSATQLIIPPTLLAASTRIEPIIWLHASSDWTGTSTVRVSKFAMYVTDTPTSIPNYYDGDSPSWLWDGAPNNSTSTGPAL